jgi:hypothetical protein
MYLRTWGSFKSANIKKDWVRKSQIRKVSQLRKVRKFADLRFAELNCGPLLKSRKTSWFGFIRFCREASS